MVKSGDKGTVTIAPFLKKCYEMVDDESTDSIISWRQTHDRFVIWDETQFSVELLPKYFKTTNFSSFIRQLNIYGFRKTDTDHWEFANDGFIQGQKHLLKNISRRKYSQGQDQRKSTQQHDSDEACKESENFGLWKEVENLKTGKNALMLELVNLRKHQETADNKLHLLRERLQGMEKNQQQMLSFLVMAMQSPGFLVQLLQPKENSWRMAEAGMNMLEQGTEDEENSWRMAEAGMNMLEQGTEDGKPVISDGMIIRYQPHMNETPKPIIAPSSGSEAVPECNPSSDFFIDSDFMKVLMDENLCSSENPAPFILPDFPDDGVWDQLLLTSQFLGTPENAKVDSQEPVDSEMEMKATLSGTELEKSQSFECFIEQMERPDNFETEPSEKSQSFEWFIEKMERSDNFEMEPTVHETHVENSQNLELPTEKMGELASGTNNKQEQNRQ